MKRPTNPTVPRQLADIQAAYNDLLGKVAQSQYQVYVYTKEVQALNELLEDLNKEAAMRNALDADAKQQNVKKQDASKPEPGPTDSQSSKSIDTTPAAPEQSQAV